MRRIKDEIIQTLSKIQKFSIKGQITKISPFIWRIEEEKNEIPYPSIRVAPRQKMNRYLSLCIYS